jgi:hypothetical protein
MYYFTVIAPSKVVFLHNFGFEKFKAYRNWQTYKFIYGKYTELWWLTPKDDMYRPFTFQMKGLYINTSSFEYAQIYSNTFEQIYNINYISQRTYITQTYPRIYFGVQKEFYNSCKLRIYSWKNPSHLELKLPKPWRFLTDYDSSYYTLKRGKIVEIKTLNIFDLQTQYYFIRGNSSVLLNHKYYWTHGHNWPGQHLNLIQHWDYTDTAIFIQQYWSLCHYTIWESPFMSTWGDIFLGSSMSFYIAPYIVTFFFG